MPHQLFGTLIVADEVFRISAALPTIEFSCTRVGIEVPEMSMTCAFSRKSFRNTSGDEERDTMAISLPLNRLS